MHEFRIMIEDSKFLVKFVRDHSRVKKLYSGTALQLFSETRFCGASIMMNSLNNNKDNIHNLLDDNDFDEVSTSVKPTTGHINPKEEFQDITTNGQWWANATSFGDLIRLIARACALSETQGVCSAHVYPLLKALNKDIGSWSAKAANKTNWSEATLEAIGESVQNRWAGSGQRVGACREFHLLATLLNPFTTLKQDDIDLQTWGPKLDRVFNQFFSGKDEKNGPMRAVRARNELDLYVLNRSSDIGEQITMFKEMAGTAMSLGKDNLDKFRLLLEFERDEMLGACVAFWSRADVVKYCPNLAILAIPLMQMTAQNASIERICKAHSVNHTKVRNRLSLATQQDLLYIYVNERLLDTKIDPTIKDLFTQMLEAENCDWDGSSSPQASSPNVIPLLSSEDDDSENDLFSESSSEHDDSEDDLFSESSSEHDDSEDDFLEMEEGAAAAQPRAGANSGAPSAFAATGGAGPECGTNRKNQQQSDPTRTKRNGVSSGVRKGVAFLYIFCLGYILFALTTHTALQPPPSQIQSSTRTAATTAMAAAARVSPMSVRVILLLSGHNYTA
jgi:hypothetical protein